MAVSDAANNEGRIAGFTRLLRSLGNRKTGYMALFGFSSGLPYALLLGTLTAWLSDAKVDLETMGVISLIGLAYAFKFLWSPLLDRVSIPGLVRLGRRKQWLVVAQLVLGLMLMLMAQMNPNSAVGLFSLCAGVGAFASATQDIVIDAWRVDIADETATLDTLSAVYQLGYRAAVLVGGALSLFIADAMGWTFVYTLMGGIMLVVGFASLYAPDTHIGLQPDSGIDPLREAGQLDPKIRGTALGIVGTLWLLSLGVVFWYMVMSLVADPANRPDSVAFVKMQGPIIVIATVVIPSIIAAILARMQAQGRNVLHAPAPAASGIERALDHGYRALVLPLIDIMGRLGWAAVLVLALVLTYRLTDTIWGSFASPFYLQELGYTKSEMAIASKFFGVGALMFGVALGGVLFATVGRMATMTIGAITAALTNLLYADLATGGTVMASTARMTGFTWAVEHFGGDERMAKLMLAIGGENIAGGMAGTALVAYLSSITSKQYSAVQYALLSSLTFLVGTLGRGALGQMIEEQGYYAVFIFTTELGGVAVLLCLLEWARQRRANPAAAR
ncbi:MAG: MFS transporter [Sphingobium sp.]